MGVGTLNLSVSKIRSTFGAMPRLAKVAPEVAEMDDVGVIVVYAGVDRLWP